MSSSFMKWMAKKVDEGTPGVIQFQKDCGITPEGPTKPFLHALMCFGAGLGNELFFILFLPLFYWEVDYLLFRRIISLWCFSYYFGQMLKDMAMLPRPPAGKQIECTGPSSVIKAFSCKAKPTQNYIVRLESHYETEGGMPSTHAMNAISMPWMIIYLIITSKATVEFPDFYYWVAAASTWTCLCVTSRLYLGVHSPADIVGGLIIGLSSLGFHLYFTEEIDQFVFGNSYAFLFIPALFAFLSYIYPRPRSPRWVSSPGDTTLILGVGAGTSTGWALLHLYANVSMERLPIHLPFATLGELGKAVVRAVFSVAVLFLVRIVCKNTGNALLLKIRGPEFEEKVVTESAVIVENSNERPSVVVKKRKHVNIAYDNEVKSAPVEKPSLKKELVEIPPGRRYDIELPVKYFTYYMIGFICTGILPFLQEKLSIVGKPTRLWV